MSGTAARGLAAGMGVIFDMDGVLVLTERAHWLAWKEAANARGVDLKYETFLSCFGRVNADCIRIMFGANVPAAEGLKIAEDKEAAFREIVAEDMPLAPGTPELLALLRFSGAKLAVGSSAPPENVAQVLDIGQIREHFTATVDGSQVKRGKPEPDVFLKAGQLLEIAPNRCAVVEDAPAGIEAARAAGMVAIGVAATHSAKQLSDAGAHMVVAKLADLSVDLIVGEIGRRAR